MRSLPTFIVALLFVSASQGQNALFRNLPQGSENRLSSSDDGLFRFDIANTFPLFRKQANYIWVSTNGYLTINSYEGTRSWSWRSIIRNGKTMIAPYFMDLLNENKKITYHEVGKNDTGSQPFIAALDEEIAKRRLNFRTQNAIAVTFDGVDVYDFSSRGNLQSFQVVFVSDGVNTYSIFNYDQTPVLVDRDGFNTAGLTGFYEDNNECVNTQDFLSTLKVPIYQLPLKTNTNVKGRYVFPMTSCNFPNHCAVNPCFNSGKCSNFDNGFQCECLGGYKGATCNETIEIIVSSSPMASMSSSASIEMSSSMLPSPSLKMSSSMVQNSSIEMSQSMSSSASIEMSSTMLPSPSIKMSSSMLPSSSIEMSQSMSSSASIEMSSSMLPSPSIKMSSSMLPSSSIEMSQSMSSMSPSASIEMSSSMLPSASIEMSSSMVQNSSIEMSQSMSSSASIEMSSSMSPSPSIKMSSSMSPSPSIEMSSSMLPSPSIKMSSSMLPSSSIEMSQSMSSMSPSASIEMSSSMLPSPSIKMSSSMLPSSSIEMSQSMSSMSPSASIEMSSSMLPSASIEMSSSMVQNSSIEMSQSMSSSASIEMSSSMSPSPSIKMSSSMSPSPSIEMSSSMSPSPSIEMSSSMLPSSSIEMSQSMSSMLPSASIEMSSILPSSSISPTPSSSVVKPETTVQIGNVISNQRSLRSLRMFEARSLLVHTKFNFSSTIVFLEIQHYSRPIQAFVDYFTFFSHAVSHLQFSNAQPSNNLTTMDIMLIANNNYTMKSSRFQYGQHMFHYQEGHRNCFDVEFEQEMINIPSVKLQPHHRRAGDQHIANGMVTAWLVNVTRSRFTYCVRELVPFVGSSNGTLVSYLAISGSLTDNSTIVQSHRIMKMRGTNNCMKLPFLQSDYINKTHVFVTAEGTRRDMPLVAWVRSSNQNETEVCIRAACSDAPATEIDAMINVIVRGDINPCKAYACPRGKECHVKGDKPYCSCIEVCPAVSGQEICGTDNKTYRSECYMQVHNCKNNINVTKKHNGVCVHAPIVSGRAMLIQDKELPSIFCKYISFPKHVFKPLSKVHVFLTVSWTNSSAVNSTPSTASKNDAAASWSEDLTSEGFRGCVLVAGRNTFEENRHKNNVSLHWVAMQKRSVEEHEGQAIGTMEFGTWYTGTRCQKLDKVYYEGSQIMITSVEHTKRRNFRNAMTVWTELKRSKNGSVPHPYICARELQNFDGVHEGIKVHYTFLTFRAIFELSPVLHQWLPIVFTWQPGEASLTGAVCNTVSYPPSNIRYSNPTFALGIQSIIPDVVDEVSPVLYTDNDLVVWIENVNKLSIKICAKSIAKLTLPQMYMVHISQFPELCPLDHYYYGGSCYQHLGDAKHNYTEAVTKCQNFNSSVLGLETELESNYFRERIADNAVWHSLRKMNSTAEWQFPSGSNSMFRNWLAGEPSAGYYGSVVDVSPVYGWRSSPWSYKASVVCEKASNPV